MTLSACLFFLVVRSFRPRLPPRHSPTKRKRMCLNIPNNQVLLHAAKRTPTDSRGQRRQQADPYLNTRATVGTSFGDNFLQRRTKEWDDRVWPRKSNFAIARQSKPTLKALKSLSSEKVSSRSVSSSGSPVFVCCVAPRSARTVRGISSKKNTCFSLRAPLGRK